MQPSLPFVDIIAKSQAMFWHSPFHSGLLLPPMLSELSNLVGFFFFFCPLIMLGLGLVELLITVNFHCGTRSCPSFLDLAGPPWWLLFAFS